MRQREKDLSGPLRNLLDTDIKYLGRNGVFRTTIPVTEEYGTNCRSHFDDSFEMVGIEYGKLNGCFRIYYPEQAITAAEKATAKALDCQEPSIPKYQHGQGYFIVSRVMAIKAIIEDWLILPQLLIPAKPVVMDDEHFTQGFVLASLLVDDE